MHQKDHSPEKPSRPCIFYWTDFCLSEQSIHCVPKEYQTRWGRITWCLSQSLFWPQSLNCQADHVLVSHYWATPSISNGYGTGVCPFIRPSFSHPTVQQICTLAQMINWFSGETLSTMDHDFNQVLYHGALGLTCISETIIIYGGSENPLRGRRSTKGNVLVSSVCPPSCWEIRCAPSREQSTWHLTFP